MSSNKEPSVIADNKSVNVGFNLLTLREIKALSCLLDWTMRKDAEWRVQHLVACEEMQRSGECPRAADHCHEWFDDLDSAAEKIKSVLNNAR